jgi:hypothetical protein
MSINLSYKFRSLKEAKQSSKRSNVDMFAEFKVGKDGKPENNNI